MSHSLHRRGSACSLKNDFVLLVTPAVGINHVGAGPKLWKVLDIVTEAGPDNIGSYETGTIYSGVTIEEIRSNMPETPRVRCCFDSKEKMFLVLKRIKELDFGLSVTISGLNEEILDMCKQLNIPPHSVNYSLGIHGATEKLPPEELLELITMCGHGMISRDLVAKAVEEVKSGKKTPHDAAVMVAQPCVCGIFNVARAEKLLEKYLPAM
ncbi:MAG: hypothetical protein HFF50_07830 [Lawsonibacter sp.]|nr:hypothetical protein [Lawsonibacter sp.]